MNFILWLLLLSNPSFSQQNADLILTRNFDYSIPFFFFFFGSITEIGICSLSYCQFYVVAIVSSKFSVSHPLPGERFCSFRGYQHMVIPWSGLIQINNKIEIFNKVFLYRNRKD